MREIKDIKFRGLHEGAWKYGYFHMNVEYPYIRQNGIDYEIDEDSVGQYTGLKDKNGVKIYEGDIVKLESGFSRMVEMKEEDIVGEVRMFAGSWTIGSTTRGFLHYHVNASDTSKLFGEILGNIHENPELLAPNQSE